jgi:hypothetical protein
VLALDTLPQEKRIAVYGAIERVCGRPLAPATDADRLPAGRERRGPGGDRDEANRRKKKKPKDPRQMDFWEDMQRPITEIDTLMASRDRARDGR